MSTLKETTTATSTAVIALLGAVSGFSAFAGMLPVGSTVQHVEVYDDFGNWEISNYLLSGTATLVRQSVESSSNGGQPVVFGAGTKTVLTSVADSAVLPSARINRDVTGAAALVGLDGKNFLLQSGASTVGLRKSKSFPLLQCVGAANFGISGTGATKADSYTPLLSPQAITVTSPNAGVTANLDSPAVSLDISQLDDFLLAWYTPDPTLVNGITVLLSSDAGFANYYRVPLFDGATATLLGARDAGWNIQGWKKSEMTVGAGNPNPASIVKVRLQVNSSAGGASVTWDSIQANCKTRAKAMVIFDDGWSEAYDFNSGHGMYTAMKARGLKGNVSLIGGLLSTPSYMTHVQAREIYDAGFGVSVHGIAYQGTVGNYQNLLQFAADADAITNIQQNRDCLRGLGLEGALDWYVFPQGKYKESYFPLMRNIGITMARGTGETLTWPYFPAPDYLMHVAGVDHGGKTFAQMKPFIDRAILTGATVIIYGHRIQTAAGATGLFVTQAEFEQTLDYLVAQSANIDVVTQGDWKAQVLAGRIVS